MFTPSRRNVNAKRHCLTLVGYRDGERIEVGTARGYSTQSEKRLRVTAQITDEEIIRQVKSGSEFENVDLVLDLPDNVRLSLSLALTVEDSPEVIEQPVEPFHPDEAIIDKALKIMTKAGMSETRALLVIRYLNEAGLTFQER